MTAKVDPNAFKDVPRIEAAKEPVRFKLKLHNIDPTSICPNGDRYMIEELEVDDTVQFGQLLVIVQDPSVDPRDPRSNPQVENRGIIAGVIVTAGNGHLLGLPDPRIEVNGEVERHAADVPVFYKPGDVVLLDRTTKGRPLRYANRDFRLVNQIDILAKVDGIKLVRNGDHWEQVDSE